MKNKQIRSGLSYVLVILMVFSIPFFYKDAYSVYAADDYTIDMSTLSEDLEIRSSGGSIWVNTGSAIISTGVPATEQVVLTGELTMGAVKVNSSSSDQEELNIKLSGASIENPNSSGDTFTVTSNTALEIELSGDNYITNAALEGSAILMRGSNTDLTITGSGFLSAVMSDTYAQGSAIGGGYVNGTNIAIGDIVISGGAEIYAEVGYGTGIGGGYASDNGQLSTGAISVENSSVSAIVIGHGSGIGGGYVTRNDHLSTGGISVENSSASAIVGSDGSGIGGGFASESQLSTGAVSVKNSSVSAIVSSYGSGIGGGFAYYRSQLSTGEISVENSSVSAIVSSYGAGIGGGFAWDDSQLSTGGITVKNSSVSAIAREDGAGIGGGYAYVDSQLSTGEISVENSSVSAIVDYEGTGIGGGFAYYNGQLSTGEISVENSSVSAIVSSNGSGIGGGFADNGPLTTGAISVENSSVSAIVSSNGSGIGGGYAYSGQLSTGEISVENSSVSAIAREDGAGIGGGYATDDGQLSIGEISVENSSVSAIVIYNGAGIGGGYTSFTGQLGTGVITLDGGYITASAGAIDIGEGYIANGGIITVPSIHILGGSVYSVNDKIDPAPTDGAGKNVYRVTVPAISPAGGDLITTGSYTARTVTGADEHGSTFKTRYPSAGAFIYLPQAAHTGIDIGTLKGGVAKVKDTSTTLDTYDNTVMFPKRIELTETSKTIKVGESFTVSAIVTPTDWYYAPSSNDYTVTDTNPGVVNFTSSSGILTVIGDAVGSTQMVYGMVDDLSVATTLNITVSDQSSPSPERFLIKASSGTGGSISESGDIYVSKGGDKTFTFTPDDKYRIKDVMVDGKSIGTPSSYAFDNVQSNHTISVEFERHFPFTDVPNAWFRESIEYVYFSDLMNGISGTLFDPQGDMSRSMFVSTIGRMDGVSDGPAVTGFTDTDNTAYYASHVKWSRDTGVVKGISESLFAPNDTMTREQAATLIVRYAEYLGKDLSTSGATGYSDINQAGSWARDDILKAQNAGYMSGVGSNRFDPKKSMSRAEMAELLVNVEVLSQ